MKVVLSLSLVIVSKWLLFIEENQNNLTQMWCLLLILSTDYPYHYPATLSVSSHLFAIPPPFHYPSTFSLSRHLFTWIHPPWNDIGFLSPRNAQHGIAFDVASQFSHRAGVQASICHRISGLGLHKEGLFAYDDTPTLWKSLGPFYFVCLMISVLLVLWLCFFNSFPFFKRFCVRSCQS